jgi:hypothetical protein
MNEDLTSTSTPTVVVKNEPFVERRAFKSIFTSKTFWVNAIAFVSFIVQQHYGFVINEAIQVQILAVINILLRSITSEGVKWA